MPDVWNQQSQKKQYQQVQSESLIEEAGEYGCHGQQGKDCRYNQVNQAFMLEEANLDQQIFQKVFFHFRLQFPSDLLLYAGQIIF